MGKDHRRLPMVAARAVKGIYLRDLAALVSEKIGRPISHQTIANIEQNWGYAAADDVKAALCEILGLAAEDMEPKGEGKSATTGTR